MSCKNQRPDYRCGFTEDHKKSKTSIENYAYEALTKFHTMIDQIEHRRNKRADLNPKVDPKCDHRALQPAQPFVPPEPDPPIDDFLVNSASKVVRTIDDLSLELISLSEKNDHFRNRNQALESEIDKLRSMIRISSGSSAEYRGRVSELRKLVVRASRQTELLKRSLESEGSAGEDRSASYRERIGGLEASISELATKLRNDREAMQALERPSLSEYLTKIARLGVCSEGLVRQLSRTGADLRARSCGIESSDSPEYPKIVAGMERLVKHVSVELRSLKSLPAKIGTRIGGESCVRYLQRLGSLEKLVGSSLSIIDKLIDAAKVPRGETDEDFRIFAESRDRVEALEALAKRLKSGVKGLEIAVASGESANLIRRIRESDRSLRRLRGELAAGERRNGSLSLELSGARIAYDEKVEELERLRKKYERAASRMKRRGIDPESEDLRELGAEARNHREELDRLRPEVATLRSERADLVEETSRVRAAVEERDERLARISEQKEAVERALAKAHRKKEIDMRKKEEEVAVAVEEVESLRRENSRLKSDLELASNRPVVAEVSTDCRIQCAETEAATKEAERLRTALEETTQDLKTTRTDLAASRNESNRLTMENTRVDLELSRMRIQNETLIARLNSEKSTTTETLQNYDKLMMDFRLLNGDIESLTIERSSIRSDLEVALRERNAARAEIEETRLENSALRGESATLRKLLDESAADLEVALRERNAARAEIEETRLENSALRGESATLRKLLDESAGDLEGSRAANEATKARLAKLAEENLEVSARLDSLARDNEELNDELDRARSDKLDVAGALNACRLKYEESLDRLNSMATEAKDLQERLRVALRDSGESASRLSEENASLRGAIDVSEGARRSLEETLQSLDNEYRAVKIQLVASEKENKRLEEESRTLRLKADELMAELEDRRIAEEKREEAARKLDEFENATETLKIELSRLRNENASLKCEFERVTGENERMRLRGGGRKGESNRSGNDSPKVEPRKLRVADAEADGPEVALGRSEREKLCAEIVALRTENCKMRIVLSKLRATCKKLEEQRNLLKITNDLLRGDLEDARNEIADGDKNAEEYRAKIDDLMVKVEEIKERNRAATREAAEMRSLNERLDLESVDLKKRLESTGFEDRALRQEIDILRSALERVNDDNSKRRCDFAETEEELAALKGELSRVRVENDSLRNELDARREECRRLGSERGTLERELEELKRSRILAEAEGNELRGECEKLKVLGVGLEGKLTDALREIGKYTVAAAKLNGLEDKLKGLLGDYVATKKLLRSANDEVNRLRRLAETCTRGEYDVNKKKDPRDALVVSGVQVRDESR